MAPHTRKTGSVIALVVSATLGLSLAACSPPSGSDPSASPSAPSSPTPSASFTVVPDIPLVTGPDVAILERLESPTTGETWHEPVPIDNLGLLTYPDSGIEDDYNYFEVGNRGDATIVVAVPAYFDYFFGGYSVYAMFEIDGGEARMLTCPSARAGDTCLDWSTDWEEPGRSLDPDTHYDSLTYPERIQPLEDWTLTTAHLAASDWVDSTMAFGDANEFPTVATTSDERSFLGRDERIEIVELGDSTVVEFRQAGAVPGLTDSRLAIETPYGGVIPSNSTFTSAYYGAGAVTWNDGVDTFTHPELWGDATTAYPVRAAGLACFGPDETLALDFDPSEWDVAGTHRLGFDVYLPADADNDLARAVWITMRDNSWGEDIEPGLAYPYATLDEFLDARSVFAWERPDGEWVIAMDGFAGQRVYECA
jgi:hypothetical protein